MAKDGTDIHGLDPERLTECQVIAVTVLLVKPYMALRGKNLPQRSPILSTNHYLTTSASLASSAGPNNSWAIIFPWGSTSTLKGIPPIP